MIKKVYWLVCLLFTMGVHAQKNEVMYHVFQRSFFDSNGDGHGDLKGMQEKLDYLEQLGVTSILLTPLYQSDFYHNYFAKDFRKIDEEYGAYKEYRDLVVEVHRRKMKIYQDVEMQYVAGTHEWFADSFKKPSSEYSKYIFYNDKKNENPWYFWDIANFTTYDNRSEKIAVVNMKEQKVKDYTLKLLKFWVDPNGDGVFNDGIDGFRLDHMMDDLDNARKLQDLFKDFWTPLLAELKKVNPELQIVAEQADWGSYGRDYLTKGNVDRIFAFRLRNAIASFDGKLIAQAADSTFCCLPKGKQQVVFIENHDMPRFASLPGMNAQKLKIAAALNILIGGIPAIYYGQELGMKGEPLKGPTDGNDIPVREAFDWYASGEGPGMANWYKNTGPWWDKRNNRPNDGISLEEQQKEPSSLYNFYKELIRLKRRHPALGFGEYKAVPGASENVFMFLRVAENETMLIAVNLSGQEEMAVMGGNNGVRIDRLKLIMGSADFPRGGRAVMLPPYAVQIWRLTTF